MANDKKIVVRVNKELHKKVKMRSAQTGQSISDRVRQCLEQWIEEDERTGSDPERRYLAKKR